MRDDEQTGTPPCLCCSQRCRWCVWRGVRGCTCCLCLFFFARVNARPFIYVATQCRDRSACRCSTRRGAHQRRGTARETCRCNRARNRETWNALATRLARLSATPVPVKVCLRVDSHRRKPSWSARISRSAATSSPCRRPRHDSIRHAALCRAERVLCFIT